MFFSARLSASCDSIMECTSIATNDSIVDLFVSQIYFDTSNAATALQIKAIFCVNILVSRKMCAKYVHITYTVYVTVILSYVVVCSSFPILSKQQSESNPPRNVSGVSKLDGLSKNESPTNIRLNDGKQSGAKRGSVKTYANQSTTHHTRLQEKTVLSTKKSHFTKADHRGRRNLDVLIRELSSNFYGADDGMKDHHDIMKNAEISRMVDLGHALAPIFSRLHRRASFRERLPLIFDDHVSIGRARVAKRRATSVGDIDGNGAFDFIIADPVAKNESGKARLFLMTKGAHYLHSRDMTPGSPDFNAPELDPGHRYGTAVFRLPGGNATTGSFIAISAPGDGKHGAIYVLKLSHKGKILCHAKAQLNGRRSNTSHRAVRLSLLQKDKPRMQTVRPEITDSMSNLGILSDVREIVFQAPDGEVLATLAIDSATDANLLAMVESEYLLSTSLRAIQNVNVFPRFSVKVGVDSSTRIAGECSINSTHCHCDEPRQRKETCLRFSREEGITRRPICTLSACPQQVNCHCGGKYLCERGRQESGLYIRDGKIAVPGSDGKEVYCKSTRSSSTLTHQGDLAYAFVKQGSLEMFNETHCLCSQKSSTPNGGRCLRYFRTSYGLAIYCMWELCHVGDDEYQCDNLGSAYCRRDVTTKSYWENDGTVVGLDDVVYCHKAERDVEKATLLFQI